MMTTGHESHLPTCHQRQAKLVPKMKLIIGELHGPLQTLMANNHTTQSEKNNFESENQPSKKH